MSDSQTPAGWYQDPSGQAPYRWWDGSSWTSSTTADPSAGQPGPSMTPPAPAYGPSQRPKLAADAPVLGPLIWLIVLLPLVTLPLSLAYHPKISVPTYSAGSTPDQSAILGQIFTPLYFAMLGVGLVVYAATIVLAFNDQRRLRAIGVVRPFPWGWAFLQPVYIIGRSVIVNSVAGRRALWPLWVWIAIEIVSLVIGFSRTGSL